MAMSMSSATDKQKKSASRQGEHIKRNPSSDSSSGERRNPSPGRTRSGSQKSEANFFKRPLLDELQSDWSANIQARHLASYLAQGHLKGKDLLYPKSWGPHRHRGYHDADHERATVNLDNRMRQQYQTGRSLILPAFLLRAHNELVDISNLNPDTKPGDTNRYKKNLEELRAEAKTDTATFLKENQNTYEAIPKEQRVFLDWEDLLND